MSEQIDYGTLMHTAMRRLIKSVLEGVVDTGLPGDHHFFVTFDTNHADVAVADWLRERYPEEMTIVIQHWFEDLQVSDTGFDITLNFGDSPERLSIPFDALKTFVDPSVEFGLRFEKQDAEPEDTIRPVPDEDDPAPSADADMADPETAEADETDADTGAKDADVVQLDRFRKQ